RLRHGFFPRRRRSEGPGCAAQAVREVRLDDPSGKDAAGAVRAALRRPPGGESCDADLSRDPRPAGAYALLGPLSQGDLGGEAQDVPEPVSPRTESPLGVVSAQPPSPDEGPAPDSEPEACGPFRVLRDHRQFAGTEPFPHRGHLALEALALAPLPAWGSNDLGPPQSLPEASSASACDRGPLRVPSRSECVT